MPGYKCPMPPRLYSTLGIGNLKGGFPYKKNAFTVILAMGCIGLITTEYLQ